MNLGRFFYQFTGLRKTFLNRGVGFYAFTHLQAASLVCVRTCACVRVRACMCVREARKCVNA